MAKRHDVLGVTGADTTIGTGVKLKGNLHSDGDISIDGLLTGDIRANGSITIGVNATVRASVTGMNISVGGNLAGDIVADGEVTIGETAHVVGDITCLGITIASGATFIGRVKMPANHRSDASDDMASDSPTDISNEE